MDEANNFEKALDKKLTEEFFDKLCHNFFELIDQEKDADTDEKVFNLLVKIWPAQLSSMKFQNIRNGPLPKY